MILWGERGRLATDRLRPGASDFFLSVEFRPCEWRRTVLAVAGNQSVDIDDTISVTDELAMRSQPFDTWRYIATRRRQALKICCQRGEKYLAAMGRVLLNSNEFLVAEKL